MKKTETPAGNLLEVSDLKVHYPLHGGLLMRKVGEVKAVDGVSFVMKAGETLGMVGESGCGKTTIGKALINLAPVTSGKIMFPGAGCEMTNIAGLSRSAMRPYRSRMQMVFQDPYSSLNPRMSVQAIIEEPLDIHKPEMRRKERKEKVAWLLEKVGLRAAYASRYPHEFSGGQRQRIGLARALATNPAFIIADEPVSALDVSIQAQIINLLQDLQEEFSLTYLFIAHDLSVVEHISDRIAVMYLGNMVELGSAEEVNRNPVHPYTKALMSAAPQPNPHKTRAGRVVLKGDVPSPLNKPSGCGFRTRCPIAKPDCAFTVPELAEKSVGHFAACPWV
ncbi:MAG: oligopeptide/dipeptide ABC transporter ATP-binding protein [Elusimicrobia bacterium]|nr:MAG: oligopeptide/dipeptide ABC transporter ATP-binding protein [Elusimicrobiota bacterium]KAF0154651.1 MAG: oligopeptide/dipeptide ABC transporter ATP-binding protein [Elusimicrobiota bacterium]